MQLYCRRYYTTDNVCVRVFGKEEKKNKKWDVVKEREREQSSCLDNVRTTLRRDPFTKYILYIQ